MNPASQPVGPGARAGEVRLLNALLRSELAAAATYEQALSRFADRPGFSVLQGIAHHHQAAAAVLRDQIRNLGGEPEAAGLYDSAAAGGGAESTIQALRVEEEGRLAEVERVLEEEQMPEECRFAIRTEVLPRCHEHIDALAALAAKARKG